MKFFWDISLIFMVKPTVSEIYRFNCIKCVIDADYSLLFLFKTMYVSLSDNYAKFRNVKYLSYKGLNLRKGLEVLRNRLFLKRNRRKRIALFCPPKKTITIATIIITIIITTIFTSQTTTY